MLVLCHPQHHVLYTIGMANKTNRTIRLLQKKNIGEFCPEQQI